MRRIGPYSIQRELARGGMGAVYLAEAPNGEEVAIKLLLAAGLASSEEQLRFQREAVALQSLDHPGILRVRSHGIDNGRLYMVMDLLSGPTLEEVVRAEGPLGEARAVDLARSMAAALAHAHSCGVVHRDLKPANVILRGEDPVLVDFGLVRLLGLDQSRLTETGTILGSPNYMAPEQAMGADDVGPAADLYGLGATLYFLLTGNPPFEGTSVLGILKRVAGEEPLPPGKLRPDLTPALEDVVLRCLEKAPGQRYPTVFALEQALVNLDDAAPGSAALAWGRYGLALGAVLALAAMALVWTVFVSDPGAVSTDSGAAHEKHEAQRIEGQGKTLSSESDEADFFSDRGADKAKRGRHAEAIEDFDQALSIRPDARTHLMRGVANFQLDRLNEALTDFDRSLSLDPRPNNGLAYSTRGVIRQRLGHHELALADFERVLRLDPSNVDLHVCCAASLSTLERYAESIAPCTEALRLQPDCAPAYFYRGFGRAKLGRYEEAVADLEQAIRLDADYAVAYAALGRVKLLLGRHEEAIADLDQALRLNPSHAQAYLSRGRYHYRAGRPEASIAEFDQALRLDPSLVEAWAARGLAKVNLHQELEAIADFDEALRLDAECVEAYANRASAYGKLGRWKEAIEDFNEALRLDPKDPGSYANRGDVKVELGDLAGAIEDFEQAHRLKPRSSHLLLSLGAAKHRAGRYAEAIVDLAQALEMGVEPAAAKHAEWLIGQARATLND